MLNPTATLTISKLRECFREGLRCYLHLIYRSIERYVELNKRSRYVWKRSLTSFHTATKEANNNQAHTY